MTLFLRKAVKSDLQVILENEQAAYPIPWTPTMLSDSFAEQYQFFVVCLNQPQEVIGHMILQPILDECHLLNICIRPSEQGRGFGKQVLQKWFELAEQQQWTTLWLEVRESNQVAQSLYSSMGFEHIATRKDYYSAGQGKREAGWLMSKLMHSS